MLQKQLISVPINSGIDTKRDEKLTDQEFFLAQENSRLKKSGSLTKRYGYSELNAGMTAPILNGYTPIMLASDGKSLINVPGADNKVFNYDKINNQWAQIENGASSFCSVPCSLKCEVMAASPANHDSQDSDYYNGTIATVYGEDRGTAIVARYAGYIVLKDRDTGTEISRVLQNFTGTNFKIRLVQSGASFVVVVASINGTTTQIEVWNSTLTTLITSTSASLVGIAPAMEFNLTRTELFVMFQASATTYRIYKVTNVAITNIGTITPTVAPSVVSPFDFAVDANNIYMAYSVVGGTGDVIRTQSTNKTTFVNVNSGQYDPIEAKNIERIGVVKDSTNLNIVFSFIGLVRDVLYVTSVLATSVFTFKERIYNYDLQSKPFLNSETLGIKIVFVAQDAISNRKSYVIFGFSVDAVYQKLMIMGTFLNGKGGNISSSSSATAPVVVNLHQISTGLIALVCREQIRATSHIEFGFGAFEEISIQSQTDFCEIDLTNNFNQERSISKLGESFSVCAGNLVNFDGRYLLSNFITMPVIESVVKNNVGGSIAIGTYAFMAMLEYIDSKGQIYRSAPSLISSTVTTTTNTSVISVTIDYCFPYGPPLGTKVVLYGNTNNGTVFYRINESTANAPGPVTISRLLSDANISKGEAIYTTGNVLANDPPSPSIHSCVHQNRIFLMTADDPESVAYSKTLIRYEPPNFSDFLFVRATSGKSKRKDRGVGIASLNDKLIILKSNSLFYLTGDGANELGQQQTFNGPEMITFDIGCKEAKSIISMPLGVMFKSDKGIYIIDQGLTLKYIGAPVEAYNSEVIFSSNMIEEENIIIFQTANRIMVYDYLFNQWSVDTIANGKDIAIWNKKTIILNSVNKIGIEDQVTYQDNFNGVASNISMRVITGWMKLSGIQDFGRIWRSFILGKYFSAHVLTVKAYYNYDDTYVETFTFNPSNLDAVYQFKCHLRKQKCESLKLEIYDTGTGRSMDLTGLTLEVGMKKGPYKLKSANQD